MPKLDKRPKRLNGDNKRSLSTGIKAEQKAANLPADDSHQSAEWEGLKAMEGEAFGGGGGGGG